MSRTFVAGVATFLIASAASAGPPAGSWKMAVALNERTAVTMLFNFSEADGKWVGDFIDSDLRIYKVEGAEVRDTGEVLKLPGHPASMRGSTP